MCDRYRELSAALRYPLRREACFGMHVHVAVGSADKAMRVIEAVLWDLPLLLALSTSSPFWRGEPTGLHSTRTVVFQSLPRSGLPPVFGCYEDFARGVRATRAAGALPDHSYLWWDVRPHPRFGTVEVRILDAQPRAGDSVALAGRRAGPGAPLRPALRPWRALRGCRPPRRRREPLAGRAPRAARPDGRCRRGHERSARRMVEELLDRVADDAAALDATEALDRVAALIREGTSADRQLALHRGGASLHEIVQSLVDETRG